MDQFYSNDDKKFKKKIIEIKKNPKDNIINNKFFHKKVNKLPKNTSWDNFMKFESFWLL